MRPSIIAGMALLQQAPRLSVEAAADIVRELYALPGSASPLPSERDQNFLIAAGADRFVLKIANATEERTMLEAQNAAMAHVANPPTRLRRFGRTGRMAICPRALPTISGETIAVLEHFMVMSNHQTNDAKEGATAFIEKRQPDYRGPNQA